MRRRVLHARPKSASIMARIMDPEPGMSVYDPCCGSAGLLIKCQLVLEQEAARKPAAATRPLKLLRPGVRRRHLGDGQHEHDHPRHGGPDRDRRHLQEPEVPSTGDGCRRFDRVVANPMWNQDWFEEEDYDADELDRFPLGAGFPGEQSADWGWVQHHPRQSRTSNGRAAHRARHRRRLPRLRQRRQQQGAGRPPLVRRAGPDRRRHLPAREPLLQHQRARASSSS